MSKIKRGWALRDAGGGGQPRRLGTQDRRDSAPPRHPT
jgi:hypothetical protein